MTAAMSAERRLRHVTAEPSEWDAAVLAHGGHLLQSWRWGAFKQRFGWEVERVAVPRADGAALAQVLFRRKAGVSIGYIPRGPILPPGDSNAFAELWTGIDEAARRRRTLTIIVEPDQELPDPSSYRIRLVPGPEPIQPSRTVKVELLGDQELMDQMHPKTRYNVRLALRRGVNIQMMGQADKAVDTFYDMLQDTASRNAFAIRAPEYYREFLQQFGENASLIFAEIDGTPVAGAIAAVFGDEAVYMFGATSTKGRADGAAFLLQHEAMRWARDRGASRYDLWGIPEYDPKTSVSESGDRLAGSTGNDRRGLFEFKTRFGGQIVRFPAPLERNYHPFLASVARRFYSAGGPG